MIDPIYIKVAPLAIGIVFVCIALLAIKVVVGFVRRRPKGNDLNIITLMKTNAMVVEMHHDLFAGTVYININSVDREKLYLPIFSIKRTAKLKTAIVKGIDLIEVTRPSGKRFKRNGWRYQVYSNGKSLEVII